MGALNEAPTDQEEVVDDLEGIEVLLGDLEVESPPAEEQEEESGEEQEEESGEEDEEEYEDDDDEEEEGETDEEELKGYSENVRKRINREIRLRRTVEDNARTVAQQRDQAANAVRQLAINSLEEKKSSIEQMAELRVLQISTLEENIQVKTQWLQAQLQGVRESGDATREIQLQSELDDLRFNKQKLDDLKTAVETQKTTELSDISSKLEQVKKANFGQPQQQQTEFPKAKAWLERNKTWMMKSGNETQRQFVSMLDEQIMREGYDPNSAAYYTELDRRIDKTFPGLRKKGKRKVAKAKGGQAAPVQKAGRQGSALVGGKKRVRLTQADLQNMRDFGLDPNNKEHLTEYARQVAASGVE